MIDELPEPGPVDTCLSCEEDKPLYILCGADHDHMHVCKDCLFDSVVAARKIETERAELVELARRGLEAIAEWEAEHGEITQEEMDAVGKELAAGYAARMSETRELSEEDQRRINDLLNRKP